MVGLGLRAWAITLVSQMVAESVTITMIAPENNNFRCANSKIYSTTCTPFQTTGNVSQQSSHATGRRYPGLVTPVEENRTRHCSELDARDHGDARAQLDKQKQHERQKRHQQH